MQDIPGSNLAIGTFFMSFLLLLFFFFYSYLGPSIRWTSNYGKGIVFIGKMLSWLSFHNFVW